MLVPLQLPYTSITTQEYLGVTSSAAYYTICKEYTSLSTYEWFKLKANASISLPSGKEYTTILYR